MGQGQIDIASVIKAAHGVGIKWFFIEDESANAQVGIPQSIKYLKTLEW